MRIDLRILLTIVPGIAVAILSALLLNAVMSEQHDSLASTGAYLSLFGVFLVGLIAFVVQASLQRRLSRFKNEIELIIEGDFSKRIVGHSDDGIDAIGSRVNALAAMIDEMRSVEQDRQWLSQGEAELASALRGNLSQRQVANQTLEFIAPYTGALVATFYIARGEGKNNRYFLSGSFGVDIDASRRSIESADLPPRAARAVEDGEIVVLEELPPDYLNIESTLGSARPREIMLIPLQTSYAHVGFIELGALRHFWPIHRSFIEAIRDDIAISLSSSIQRERVEELLEWSRRHSDELQAQKEQLEEKSHALQLSETQAQSANEELREKADIMRQQHAFLEEAAERLNEKAAELEAANLYKSEFLANVSHELRTPLNSMLVLANVLADRRTDGVSAENRELAATINSSGKDLLEIINTLLDLSKVDAGKMDVHLAPFRTDEMFGALQQSFEAIATKKEIKLVFQIAPGLPSYIVTDSQRLRQILTNLVGNAIKFTEKGSVTVRVHRPQSSPTDDQAPEKCIAFSVTDTGIGIPEDKRELIFEAFAQVDGSISRKYGGTGLGLSICRKFAELLDGRITVDSSQGQGSTFKCVVPVGDYQQASSPSPNAPLPAAAAPKSPPGTTTPTTKPASRSINAPGVSQDRRTHDRRAVDRYPEPIPTDDNLSELQGHVVLLVDDDVRNTFALSKMLTRYGLRVLLAEHGAQALEQLRDNDEIEIVLMDIMMPVMDGLEAIRRIRAQEIYQDLPILALTAHAMPKDRDECLEAGANAYLAKPVDVDKLLRHIHKLVASPPS